MRDPLDIIKNIETLYSSNTSLSVLKDFERVLDEMELYVYKNWIDGELVEGPVVKRHWITASFMWTKDKMPDPMGAKRLLEYGCKVKYEKTHLVEPRQIKSEKDYRPGTKKARLDRKPVWVVHITMPRELVSEMYEGYMSMMKNKMGIGRNNRVDASSAQTADMVNTTMEPQQQGMAPQQPTGTAAPVDMAGGTNA